MSDLVLDAASLIDFQSCRRKWLLSTEWRLARWRPKTLFDTLLRRGIIRLCQAAKANVAASEAKAAFMQTAADPGLDIAGKDTYDIAVEWCALLDTVLHGVAKTELPVLHDPLPVRLTTDLTWKLTSWADDTGQLHRWITVDQWDDEALARGLHSWRTIGDIVTAQALMVLHVIVLGQYRAGRHASAWARAYRHPEPRLNLRLQFNKPEGTRWTPSYFVDQHDLDASEWVEAAWKQGALQQLTVDVPVAVPTDSVCGNTVLQIVAEANRMRELVDADYLTVPMSRNACDIFIPCAYQNVCYQSDIVPVDKIGLYVPRKSGYSTAQREVVRT
jgi:hypothetical protein